MKSLEIILRLVEFFFNEWHQKQAQKARDKLEQNPAGWFTEHFGGLRESDKTGQADKTNAEG